MVWFHQIFNPIYSVFATTFFVMFGIIAIEGISTILGTPASSGVDHAINAIFHFDVGHVEIGHVDHEVGGNEANIDDVGFVSNAFAWLNAGRTPILILLIAFLATFSAIGYALSGFIFSIAHLSVAMIKLISVPTSFVGAIFATRYSSSFIGRIIPRDETSALSDDDMVGLVGEVVLGPVKTGETAKATFQDKYLTIHRPFVVPFHDEDIIEQGETVIIVKKIPNGPAMVIRADKRITEKA